MARKVFIFVIAYILYVPAVFGLLAVGVVWADQYVDTSENPLPGWLMVILLGIVIAAPAVIYAAVWNRPPRWARRLQQTGTRATAVITDVADTGVSANAGLVIYVKLTLEVHPPAGKPFVATIETGNSRVSIMRPGGVLMVKYDPANLKHVVIDDDQDNADVAAQDAPAPMDSALQMLTSLRPEMASRVRGVARGLADGSLGGGVYVVDADGTPVRHGFEKAETESGIAEQLGKLDELHRSAALTDAEYAAAKAKLLE